MTRVFSMVVSVVWFAGASLNGRAAQSEPDFQEVYELLRTNLGVGAETEVNQAALSGMLSNLRGKASLLVGDGRTNSPLARLEVLEDGVVVARVAWVGGDLADLLATGFRSASSTNRLKGLVLDLRFADGDDFGETVAVAELFVAQDQALLDWGDGLVRSKIAQRLIELPVAVLVNRETLGAAEALAGVLRETGVGLLLGNVTAGRALAGRDFELKTGQTLRIAMTPVKLGDGSEITSDGVKPDIRVAVTLEQERAFVAEPFLVQTAGRVTAAALGPGTMLGAQAATNRPARRLRITEADLVRERREGTNLLDATPVRDAQPEKPVIRDPVLARAVDLLKGLAVVRGDRS